MPPGQLSDIHHTDGNNAFISEIFSSIQGEGLLIGLRQLFVRFSGCSFKCRYCDTRESRALVPTFRVWEAGSDETGENLPGPELRGFHTYDNPVSSSMLTAIITPFMSRPYLHHSVSLTGGEPLEQTDFLKEWLYDLAGRNPQRVYLETNGLHPDRLREVIGYIDIISMDIKLHSSTGAETAWDIHREFLSISSRKEVFVKVVVNSNSPVEEIVRAASLVRGIDPDIPFIIQPCSPVDLSESALLHMQKTVSRELHHVRIIPQVHKYLNLK